MATLLPADDFNVEEDCTNLKEAFRGLGTVEKVLIDILCHRSVAQRVEIYKAYKGMFGCDLIKEIKEETSGNLREVLVSLCNSTPRFLARVCHNAIKGVGTCESALINVLVALSKSDIEAVCQAYQDKYKRNLEEDVADDTSGTFKHVLVSLIQGNRSEDVADYELAVKDAQELYDAGQAKWGTNESTFNRILVARSPRHLRAVFNEYVNIANGNSLAEAIEEELSGDTKRAFLAIVQIIKDPPMYFAQELYKSMKGLGTNDDKLIRLVVWRSEIDMVEIKECFKIVSSRKSLVEYVKGDCSGDYRDALLELV